MTREEAIEQLSIRYLGEFDKDREAKDMAISALSENNVGMSVSHRAIAKVIDDYITNHKGNIIKQYTAYEIKTLLISDDSDNKGNWIPVSERLPEEDKEVLIFTKDKEINKAYHTLKEWSDTQWEWFVFGTLGYSLTYSDDEVLAWQPLPEPYKAESEEV